MVCFELYLGANIAQILYDIDRKLAIQLIEEKLEKIIHFFKAELAHIFCGLRFFIYHSNISSFYV